MASPMNSPRYVIRKSSCVVRDAEDRKILKEMIDTCGFAALCTDGVTTAGGLQRLLNDGTARISENSRVVNKSGHYAGFEDIERRSELARHLLKMYRTDSGGESEPPWYALARTMLRKGFNVDQVRRTLKKSEQEMDKFLVPAGL
jgi:hypothetical protein